MKEKVLLAPIVRLEDGDITRARKQKEEHDAYIASCTDGGEAYRRIKKQFDDLLNDPSLPPRLTPEEMAAKPYYIEIYADLKGEKPITSILSFIPRDKAIKCIEQMRIEYFNDYDVITYRYNDQGYAEESILTLEDVGTIYWSNELAADECPDASGIMMIFKNI